MVILLFCLQFLVNMGFVLSDKSWKIDRIECPYNVCTSVYCNITRPSRHRQLVNIGCTLDRPQKNIRAHFKMFYRFKYWRQFLVDVDFDMCDYLGPKTKVQLLPEAVMPYVSNFSNINHPCPFSGSIELVQFPMDKKHLRGFILPAGQYRFESEIYDSVQNVSLIRPIVYLTISAE